MLKRRSTSGDLYVHQGRLEHALRTLFSSEVIKDAKKAVAIKHPQTGQYLEVDVWYPEFNLCFEFQDDHHYQATWYHQKPLSVVQEHDNIKRYLLLRRGQTLIQIPCWWDGSTKSLKATINFHRPDLLQSAHADSVIPPNPPGNFFYSEMQLMLASFPNSLDLVDVSEHNKWWLGEKYDGVRCFWSPHDKRLYSRHGLSIIMHLRVTKLFVPIVLDGEIWCGRSFYLETNVLIQANWQKLNWSLFRVICFDEASQNLSVQPFEHRYSFILSSFPSDHPTTIIAPRFLCASVDTLTSSLCQIVEEGGEGIILRKSGSLYEKGRSSNLIKLKGSRGDQEALVIGVWDDGSLELQLPDGITFVVPKSECALHRQAVCGDVVSFTYDFKSRRVTHDFAPVPRDETRDLAGAEPKIREDDLHVHDTQTQSHAQALRSSAHGVPSNPSVYRIREDMSWEDVLKNSGLPVRLFLNEQHQKIADYKLRRSDPDPSDDLPLMEIPTYAMFEKIEDRRAVFDNIAQAQNFDPLVPDNWYTIPRSVLKQQKECRSVIRYYYEGKLSSCLMQLYPDIGLQKSPFIEYAQKKRREILETFATSKGRDFTDPHFWYSLNPSELRTFKGMTGFKKYYKTRYADSVMRLFPELHLDKRKFVPSVRNRKGTKMFFDKYAMAKGFDPLVPTNWYTISHHSLQQYKGYNIVKGSKLSELLMWVYPTIGLKTSQFKKNNVRTMLERIARIKGGDPLDPQFWYSFDPLEFKQFKDARAMLRWYYRRKYVSGLITLFPDLNLDTAKFPRWSIGN